MLPYLEITHTESQCHVGLCLIKPNTPGNISNLTYSMSCRRRWMGESRRWERHVSVKGLNVKEFDPYMYIFPSVLKTNTIKCFVYIFF